ncbi:hypothetical protein LSTR_LSTR010911 [Laodelphax striatellus]|uniref:Uncharacterized protein n=1 Tax=Laodelphax striatellus TaxID=195883 RepID=A0A482WYI6_LAOST|nr:hypothetical protein LSTR_LSTR010911 [Laodelphax striatellus]
MNVNINGKVGLNDTIQYWSNAASLCSKIPTIDDEHQHGSNSIITIHQRSSIQDWIGSSRYAHASNHPLKPSYNPKMKRDNFVQLVQSMNSLVGEAIGPQSPSYHHFQKFTTNKK